MYLAIDDTDSTNGMCTTFLALRLIAERGDLDLIGHPRLVRLNPAVPWKTRGNGSVVMRLGRGIGELTVIGRVEGEDIVCFEDGSPSMSPMEMKGWASPIVERWSRVQEGAEPGLVVSRVKPPQSLYWEGVRTIVPKDRVDSLLDSIGAETFRMSGGRGIVGSACGMAWRPRDRTYELIAYRNEDRWGTPRDVDAASVIDMDRRCSGTFNNVERDTGKVAIAPATPCPVLYGIRGDDPDELAYAHDMVSSEPDAGWLTFLSNQGTDDHVVRRFSELVPLRSYSIDGVVSSRPSAMRGGHVLFTMSTSHGDVDCAAYEPSKGFRDIVRQLLPGDAISVVGELRDEPRTMNIERLHVRSLVTDVRKGPNPTCPSCGRAMKSAGAGAGYRCRRCGTRSEGELVEHPRALAEGVYEPPVCSRRHLSKPLSRM